MTYMEALVQVIALKSVARQSWPEGEFMLLKDGFLSIKNSSGFHRLWVSDGDLLGTDWITL